MMERKNALKMLRSGVFLGLKFLVLRHFLTSQMGFGLFSSMFDRRGTNVCFWV